ncbi:hypothetical protein RhiirC2_800202 [Rhizophagus irregularis]|uniref:Uncharacterized protein n=1 Tax=Rhizophagus irregularis TaxID=588596 RepID=A0A2N1M3Y8_9GLOM|nr:hypothetical protein RhiirC2_800202 [Rhizophagus irregularis]
MSQMQDRHTCEEADAKRLIKKGLTPEPYLYGIPESGKCFEYIVVENDSSQRVGDKMEYPEVVRRLDALAQKLAEKWVRGYIKNLHEGLKKDEAIISHLWKGARIYAKKLFDTTYADRIVKCSENNAYCQSFLNALDKQEESICLKLLSLLKEISEADRI